MNRLGFRHDNLARTLPEIARSEHLAIDAVYTHFATADEPEHPAFGEQRERFENVLAALPALGITPRYRHAANSAALLRDETFADDVSWFLAVARQRSGKPGARGGFADLCRGKGHYATAACAAVAQLVQAHLVRLACPVFAVLSS